MQRQSAVGATKLMAVSPVHSLMVHPLPIELMLMGGEGGTRFPKRTA